MNILSLFSFKNWNRAYRSKEKPTKLHMRNNKTNKYKDKENKEKQRVLPNSSLKIGNWDQNHSKTTQTLPPSIYACSKQEKSLRLDQKEESFTNEDRSYKLTCEKSPRTDRILRWEFSEMVPGQQTGRCGWRAIATVATRRSPKAASGPRRRDKEVWVWRDPNDRCRLLHESRMTDEKKEGIFGIWNRDRGAEASKFVLALLDLWWSPRVHVSGLHLSGFGSRRWS